MPIPLPNLDNRKFEDLVDEMQALIPRYAPQWTDHNLSDPGLMLIDLFAWLAEALIYRLNRIPEAGEARFLELLGAAYQPAQPATVTLVVSAENLTHPLILPRGTPLLARTENSADRPAFATTQELRLSPQDRAGTVTARQTAAAAAEALTVSSGDPYQVFAVRQPHLAFDPQTPDRLALQITVDDRPWQYRPNLLDSGPADQHFTLEPRLSAIRFGDGCLGRIPAPGAVIRADYLSTRGLAGNIAAGTRLIIDQKSDQLSPDIRQALQAGAEIALISRTAATGGQDPTSLAAARHQVHNILTQRWRAVTAADFEALARNIPGCKIARAKCVPQRDLSAADPETARTGHVSIIVVPDNDDPRPAPTMECLAEIYHLLDQRRLIASRHHVLGPAYTNVRIRADIVRNTTIAAETVRQDAAQQLAAFFHPLTGGPPEFNQKGWPFGRDVYISEVYHVLEQAAGVDYVNTVALYYRADESDEWQAAGQRIRIGPRHLVYFDRSASVITVRTVA